eukprot:580548-Pleurochrysis_carterae.AAC.1
MAFAPNLPSFWTNSTGARQMEQSQALGLAVAEAVLFGRCRKEHRATSSCRLLTDASASFAARQALPIYVTRRCLKVGHCERLEVCARSAHARHVRLAAVRLEAFVESRKR